MIMSMLAKRMIRENFEIMSRDHIDTDALLKDWADDAVWDGTSELGVGQTIKGKKAIADWFHRWEQDFPKRKLVVKNVCLKGSFLPAPNNVEIVDWTCWEADKQGREYKYDGATTIVIRNMKAVKVTEHISFVGLPQLSTLIKPTAKA